MKKKLCLLLSAVYILLTIGCTSVSSYDIGSDTTRSVPENSKMSGVKVGMGQAEVMKKLGKPDSITGGFNNWTYYPVFNCFLTRYMELYFYKNLGVIEFSSSYDNQNLKVIYTKYGKDIAPLQKNHYVDSGSYTIGGY